MVEAAIALDKCYANFEPPPEAPTFSPNEEEFRDPLAYIAKIKHVAENYGIIKIKPPPSWQPPFVIDIDKFSFTPRLQKLNELEALNRVRLNFLDSIARFWHMQGSELRVPVLDGRPLDLYKLHKIVKEFGGYDHLCTAKKWSEVSKKLSIKSQRGQVIREHYERILIPFDIYHSGLALEHAISNGKIGVSPSKPQMSRCSSSLPPCSRRTRASAGEKKEVENGDHTEEKQKPSTSSGISETTVAGLKPLAEIKQEEGETKKDVTETIKSSDPMDVVYCKICSGGDDEDLLLLCDTCDQSFHTYCLLPPLQNVPRGDWRCPKCITDEVKKPSEAYGFAQAERAYSLHSFGEMADKFKTDYFGMPCHMVPTNAVEKEFWRLVSASGEGLTVEYGADLLTDEVGSGFPKRSTTKDTAAGPLSTEDEIYIKSPWNLNNLPSLPNSVLSHISVDISGMKVPWVYVGMCFSTFCWHTEDHWSYSINYLHWGEPKTWYGVSGLQADEFENCMKEIAPELFSAQPDLLHHLVTMTNPRLLMAKGVKIYTINQCAGEFVVTFPRAYHAGFNQGYNFAEAVNFCPSDWLAVGRRSMAHYARVKRFCVFAHDELVCKIAAAADLLDLNVCAAASRELATMIDDEKRLRDQARSRGIVTEEKFTFETLADDERQCRSCQTTCFSSAVICKCGSIICLRDLNFVCSKCTVNGSVLRYRYTIDELEGFLLATEQRTQLYDAWKAKATQLLESVSQNLSDKPSLVELKKLLDEAKAETYPQHSEYMTKLSTVVKRAERCASVADQLIMQKIRTRHRQQNAIDNFSRKLRLDEVESFVQQLTQLSCRLPQTEAILEFVERVKQFKAECADLDSIYDTEKLNGLLDRAVKFDLQLPEVPKLKNALEKRVWCNSLNELMEAVEDGGKAVELSRLRSLLEEGVNLTASGLNVESDLAKAQDLLTALECDEAKAELLLNRSDTLDFETVKLEYAALRYPSARLPGLERLRNMLHRVEEWFEDVEDIQKSGTSLLELEQLLLKCRAIPWRLEPSLNVVESALTSLARFCAEIERLFEKPGRCYPLGNCLCPRRDLAAILEGQANAVRCTYGGVDGQRFERDWTVLREFENLDNLRQSLTAWEEQEGRLMERLRARTMGFCLCGAETECDDDRLLRCRLCRQAFHLACLSQYGSCSLDPLVCQRCWRTKRPSYEAVRVLYDRILTEPVLKTRAWKFLEAEIVGRLLARADAWRQTATELFRMNVSDNQRYQMLSTCLTKGLMLEIDVKPECDRLRELVERLDPPDSRQTALIAELKCFTHSSPLVPVVAQTNTNAKRSSTPFNHTAKRQRSSKHAQSTNALFHEDGQRCSSAACLQPLGDEVSWVQCEGGCEQWFHILCVDLTLKTLNAIDRYTCLKCLSSETTSATE